MDQVRIAEQATAALPAVYKNISSAGCDATQTTKLKGIYRHTWSANQLLIRKLSEDIGTLRSAGIDARLAGDTSLVLGHYRDAGARPIYRHQVKVGGLAAAMRVLEPTGWRKSAAEGENWTKLVMRATNGRRVSMTLLSSSPGQTESRDARGHVRLDGLSVGVQTKSEQLLATCLNPQAGNSLPLLQSAIDCSAILLEASADVDWAWLHDRAEAMGVASKLRLLLDVVEPVMRPSGEATMGEWSPAGSRV